MLFNFSDEPMNMKKLHVEQNMRYKYVGRMCHQNWKIETDHIFNFSCSLLENCTDETCKLTIVAENDVKHTQCSLHELKKVYPRPGNSPLSEEGEGCKKKHNI